MVDSDKVNLGDKTVVFQFVSNVRNRTRRTEIMTNRNICAFQINSLANIQACDAVRTGAPFNGGQIIFLLGEVAKIIHNGLNGGTKKIKCVFRRMEYASKTTLIHFQNGLYILCFHVSMCITLFFTEICMSSWLR